MSMTDRKRLFSEIPPSLIKRSIKIKLIQYENWHMTTIK